MAESKEKLFDQFPPELPWRDKDEDDLFWAKRCARAAIRTLGKKPKTGLKR